MKTEKNQPINAFIEPNEIAGSMIYGLTKREYFAAIAMQGIMANCAFYLDKDNPDIHRIAVFTADALITELNK